MLFRKPFFMASHRVFSSRKNDTTEVIKKLHDINNQLKIVSNIQFGIYMTSIITLVLTIVCK